MRAKISLCSYSELLSSNYNAVVVKDDSSEDLAPVFVFVFFFFSVEGKRHREDNLLLFKASVLHTSYIVLLFCSYSPESKRIEQQGGYMFTNMAVPQTFNFGQ